MPRRPVKANAAALVFALLVLASLTAFAWAQRVKRDPLVLDRVHFRAVGYGVVPSGECRADRIRIRFRVTRSDEATVQVIKPGGHLVKTLARDRFLKRYHFFTFYWDGRSRVGDHAPVGRYKLRVTLLGQERTLVPPGTIHLHQARPSACGKSPRPSP